MNQDLLHRSKMWDFNSCGKWSSRVLPLILWWSLAWFPYFYSDCPWPCCVILCRPNTHTLSHLYQPCLSSYTTHQKNWIVCPCPYRDIWSWKGNKVPLTFLRGTTSRIKNIPLNLDADHKTKSCVPHYFFYFYFFCN